MKLVIKTAAIAGILSLASTAAMAQTAATGTVNVTAIVAATCTINTLASAGLLGMADFSNGGASLIKTATYTVSPAVAADCNTPTHVTLTSANGAATSGATAGGGYANYFDYTATAAFGGVTATLDTIANPASTPGETVSAGPTAGPAAGALVITVKPDGTPKLAAGTYNDVLTVTLTAD